MDRTEREQRLRRIWLAVLGVLVVATVIVSVLVVVRDRNESANASSDVSAGPLYVPRQAETGLEQIVLPPTPNVLIFGDSYTQGWGATPQTDAWAFHMGERMGWTVTVDGVGGTGFLNPGSGGGKGTYATRLSKLEAPGPFDLIILQGGSNDQKMLTGLDGQPVPPNIVAAAIDEAYAVLRERYPTSPVVVLGPVSVATNANEPKKLMDNLLSTFAANNRLFYISPVRQRWFKTEDQAELVDAATSHPNNLGYVRVADLVEENLRDRILAPANP